jgi:uncharacterized protein (TIGR02453 family)
MDTKALIKFLEQLGKNNNKEWFDAHKKEYETLRKDWIQFVSELIPAFGAFDPTLLHLEPKDCLFRINRDVRFSKDKSPYKTNFGSSLNAGGKKAEFFGYYLHIEPKGCFMAGGAYGPSPASLAAIRQEIDYNAKEFHSIVTHKSFIKHFGSLTGETLVRPPKGYEVDNPSIGYLKHKSFLAQRSLSMEEVTSTKLIAQLVQTGQAMKPLIDFLNRAVKG